MSILNLVKGKKSPLNYSSDLIRVRSIFHDIECMHRMLLFLNLTTS